MSKDEFISLVSKLSIEEICSIIFEQDAISQKHPSKIPLVVFDKIKHENLKLNYSTMFSHSTNRINHIPISNLEYHTTRDHTIFLFDNFRGYIFDEIGSGEVRKNFAEIPYGRKICNKNFSCLQEIIFSFPLAQEQWVKHKGKFYSSFNGALFFFYGISIIDWYFVRERDLIKCDKTIIFPGIRPKIGRLVFDTVTFTPKKQKDVKIRQKVEKGIEFYGNWEKTRYQINKFPPLFQYLYEREEIPKESLKSAETFKDWLKKLEKKVSEQQERWNSYEDFCKTSLLNFEPKFAYIRKGSDFYKAEYDKRWDIRIFWELPQRFYCLILCLKEIKIKVPKVLLKLIFDMCINRIPSLR